MPEMAFGWWVLIFFVSLVWLYVGARLVSRAVYRTRNEERKDNGDL